MLDDRGNEVIILNQAAFEDWPLKGDARMAALIQRLAVAVRGEGALTRIAVGVGLALLGITIFFGSIVLMRMSAFRGPMWIGPVAGVVVANIVGHVVFRRITWMKGERLASVVLAEGLCPCCGYNLHGIPADAGAPVVCPECGSAWRAERIKRTAEFALGSTYGSPFRTISRAAGRKNWTTRDAGGRRVELVDPRLKKKVREATGERKEELRSAVRAVTRRSRWIRWPVLGVMWGLSAWLVVGLAMSVDSVWPPVVAGCATAMICLAGVFSNFLYRSRVTRDELVKVRVCPSCGTDLAAASMDAEGRVACSECLAEWKAGVNREPMAADRSAT